MSALYFQSFPTPDSKIAEFDLLGLFADESGQVIAAKFQDRYEQPDDCMRNAANWETLFLEIPCSPHSVSFANMLVGSETDSITMLINSFDPLCTVKLGSFYKASFYAEDEAELEQIGTGIIERGSWCIIYYQVLLRCCKLCGR